MAAEDIGALVVRIEADLRDFQRGVNQVNDRVDTFGNRVKKIGGIIAGAFAVKALVNFSKTMVIAASDASEMQSKFDTVFGEMSDKTEDWAKSFQDSVGGSRVEIKGMLADSADLLAGFGANEEQAFDLSTRMQSLGTDIASFSNIQGGAEEAVERLRKGLMGETENLKALGIVINQKMLQDELVAQGDNRKLKDLSELEKMELRYIIAVRQSQNAIGDAEKTSKSFANQLRNLKGRFADVTAELGVKLLPIANKFLSFILDNMPTIERTMTIVFDTINQLITTAYEIFNENILPILKELFSWIQSNMPTIKATINTVFSAIFNIIKEVWGIIVNDLIPIFKTLYSWVEPFFPLIGKIVKGAFDVIIVIANNVIDVFGTIVGAIKDVIDWFDKFNKKEVKEKTIPTPETVGRGRGRGRIPAFAKGSNFIPFDTAAFIHKGEAIVPANNNPSNPNATNPIGGNNVNFEGMFSGAIFNVRSDNDTKLIAREIYNLQKGKSRGIGVVAST